MTLNDEIRSWYLKTYSSDDLGEYIQKGITFKDLLKYLVSAEYADIDSEEELGDFICDSDMNFDSVVRERIFEELAELLNCDYDEIYNAWLRFPNNLEDIADKVNNKLEESNKVNKALWGDYYNEIRTFAILSAENPLVMTLGIKSNRERTKLLKKYLKEGNFEAVEVDEELVSEIRNDLGDNPDYIDYKKINGVYSDEPEHSFMVMNISLKSAKAISKLFGQESFFYGKVTQVTDDMKNYSYTSRSTTATIEYWKATRVVKDKELNSTISDYKRVEVSNRVDSINDAISFYSQHKGSKFSIRMKEFESLKEIYDENFLRDSLDDTRSNKNQYLARQFIYRRR